MKVTQTLCRLCWNRENPNCLITAETIYENIKVMGERPGQCASCNTRTVWVLTVEVNYDP